MKTRHAQQHSADAVVFLLALWLEDAHGGQCADAPRCPHQLLDSALQCLCEAGRSTQEMITVIDSVGAHSCR
eukprot:3871346-Amphidinium_carterae.1